MALQDHPDEPAEPGPIEAESSEAHSLEADSFEAESSEADLIEAGRRRRPSTIGGAVYLVVLVAAGVGLGIVAHGNWRLGVRWIATSVVVAALVRLALPAREAGMLAVRHRLLDVGLLVAVGVGLWFLSTNIPNQPLP